MTKTAFKPIRKIHKWLGYLLAIQIFAWLLGGFVMSAIPLEKVHGKHLAHRQLDNPFKRADYSADLNLITKSQDALSSISFKHLLDLPVIKVQGGQTTWFNGITGEQLKAPSEAIIKQQADAHYLGNGEITAVQLLAKGPREIGYKENVWVVTYNDWCSTTLYLEAQSGQIITVRSTIWRIFDFFWMLHIMDYDEREDFNNPLLISFSVVSVLFCLSGIFLLFQAPPWRKRRNKAT
ncbi:hypothetical protein [Pseudoalteromonas phenolica]|uniref:hypothetical protein n=1 Tax=Pseudoalteromonas phenolica TaxID=161398 RepID=UPI00384AFBA0